MSGYEGSLYARQAASLVPYPHWKGKRAVSKKVELRSAETESIAIKEARREAAGLYTDNVCVEISSPKNWKACKCDGGHGYNSSTASQAVSVGGVKLCLAVDLGPRAARLKSNL